MVKILIIAFTLLLSVFNFAVARPSYDEVCKVGDTGLAFAPLRNGSANFLTMPHATSYLIASSHEGKTQFELEDRFNVVELWKSKTLCGRWKDEQGNRLMLARLTTTLPLIDGEPSAALTTRSGFASFSKPFNEVQHNLPLELAAAAEELLAMEVGKFTKPRRNFDSVMTHIYSLIITNAATFAYIFKPRPTQSVPNPDWYLAAIQGANTPAEAIDSSYERRIQQEFEDEFLGKLEVVEEEPNPPATSELQMFCRDLAHSITNYPEWHYTEVTNGVIILDDLPGDWRYKITAITNHLGLYRAAYTNAFPSALKEIKPCVIRIFRNDSGYRNYAGNESKYWSGGYYSPIYGELVMPLTDELITTVWHEAFHQYIHCASAFAPLNICLNEGHAKLFENATIDDKGNIHYELNQESVTTLVVLGRDAAKECMRELLANTTHQQFYAGTLEDVKARYNLAWSLAYFLQVGAPKVRFQPFKDLRGDYIAELVANPKDPGSVFEHVFTRSKLDKLINEWVEFWFK